MGEPELKPKVLIVDDTPENIDVLGQILKPSYRRSVALNGEKALKVAGSKDPPDLILLHVMMPEMGGRQCLEGLLGMDPSVKVVVASGYSASGPTKDALAAGAKGFVSKPYNIRQMMATVREVLDEK